MIHKSYDELKHLVDQQAKWLSLLSHNLKDAFSTCQWLLGAYSDKEISKEVFDSMLPELLAQLEESKKAMSDTLLWVKQQEQQASSTSEKVKIHSLLYRILAHLQPQIQAKNLFIKHYCAEDISLYTDPFLLSFILTKVLENAIKYSHEKEEIQVKADIDPDYLIISITDYGLGIDDQQKVRIFDLDKPLYTGTADEKGTGLSLVMVRSFMKDLHGSIEIDTTESGKTTLILKFKTIKK